MNLHLNLKTRLKEYRLRAGMTQAQLAEAVGVSKNTISSIETGRVSLSAYLALRLCSVLHCKFDDLFYL